MQVLSQGLEDALEPQNDADILKMWQCLVWSNTHFQIYDQSWSSGNAFVSEAGGLRFKSRAGQIEHSVANGSPPLRHFFERSCVARAQ